jgi:hypothetical protein
VNNPESAWCSYEWGVWLKYFSPAPEWIVFGVLRDKGNRKPENYHNLKESS